MTFQEILQSVQFVVNREGQATAAVMQIDAWEALMALLEDLEDQELVQAWMKDWRSKAGWTGWDAFLNEIKSEEDTNVLPPVD